MIVVHCLTALSLVLLSCNIINWLPTTPGGYLPGMTGGRQTAPCPVHTVVDLPEQRYSSRPWTWWMRWPRSSVLNEVVTGVYCEVDARRRSTSRRVVWRACASTCHCQDAHRGHGQMLLEQLRSTGHSAGQTADGDDAVEAHTTWIPSFQHSAADNWSSSTVRHHQHELRDHGRVVQSCQVGTSHKAVCRPRTGAR